MKAKKVILTSIALFGVAALGYGAKKVIDDHKRTQRQEELVAGIRQALSELGQIATLYVQVYASSEDYLVGGVIFEDQRHYSFVYDHGDLTYEEAE